MLCNANQLAPRYRNLGGLEKGLLVPATIRPGVVLQGAQVQLDLEKNHQEDDSLFTPMDDKSLKEHMFSTYIEKWKELLGGVRNAQDVPVRYTTRATLIPLAAADDPATGYASHDQELVARNRIVRVGEEGRSWNPTRRNGGHPKPTWTATQFMIRVS